MAGHDVAVKKVFVQASIVDTRMNVINEVEILSSVHSPYLVCYYSPSLGYFVTANH